MNQPGVLLAQRQQIKLSVLGDRSNQRRDIENRSYLSEVFVAADKVKGPHLIVRAKDSDRTGMRLFKSLHNAAANGRDSCLDLRLSCATLCKLIMSMAEQTAEAALPSVRVAA